MKLEIPLDINMQGLHHLVNPTHLVRSFSFDARYLYAAKAKFWHSKAANWKTEAEVVRAWVSRAPKLKSVALFFIPYSHSSMRYTLPFLPDGVWASTQLCLPVSFNSWRGLTAYCSFTCFIMPVIPSPTHGLVSFLLLQHRESSFQTTLYIAKQSLGVSKAAGGYRDCNQRGRKELTQKQKKKNKHKGRRLNSKNIAKQASHTTQTESLSLVQHKQRRAKMLG